MDGPKGLDLLVIFATKKIFSLAKIRNQLTSTDFLKMQFPPFPWARISNVVYAERRIGVYIQVIRSQNG